ncbi:MAG: flagellar basal body-associated FliL family protein [Candidatus Xenolissoclinum pacificiensis L6]|uniref:Flagellar protein FliL n=1 Tax=Candidatus Xenolissoclinum pacificiensis L6 TaxID=1401685 RepID=W2V0G3_9RICK|nr:MAG: flagellar basal body-associated FliL family protein [Candidatus Xenolissoclinum pacificiensis L6]
MGLKDINIKEYFLTNKKLVISVLVVCVIVLSVVLFLSLPDKGKNEKNTSDIENSEHMRLIILTPLTINISDKNLNPYVLRVGVALEIENAHDKNILENNIPYVKDIIISFLRTLRTEDFDDSEIIFLIKEELLIRINKVVDPVFVTNVLITDFVVD